MRFKFRVTKYDPSPRNHLGHFMHDDWTSISQIGKNIQGKTLKKSEYERVEDAYLNAIDAFLSESKVDTMIIDKIEMHREKFAYRVGQKLQAFEIRQISQLALREKLWCQLRSPRKAYLHFGWDYYMYLGVSRSCPSAITLAHSTGLFVEPFLSPYLQRSRTHVSPKERG